MTRRIGHIIAMVMMAMVLGHASAEEKLLDASNALKNILRDSRSIPQGVLTKAQAIAIFPGTLEISMFLGGKTGYGVMVVRKNDGSWSYPFFVSLGGAGFGFQLGVEKKDIFMAFKTKDSVKKMMNTKITLGVDASVAAGPFGESVGVGSEIDFKADIYTYTKTQGLFIGFSLDGSVMNHDYDKNIELYGNNIMPEQIIEADTLYSSYAMQEFFNTLQSMGR